jgi:hypothetical protein
VQPLVSSSAAPRCFDLGDVDVFHLHHRPEGMLCLTASGLAQAMGSADGVTVTPRGSFAEAYSPNNIW